MQTIFCFQYEQGLIADLKAAKRSTAVLKLQVQNAILW